MKLRLVTLFTSLSLISPLVQADPLNPAQKDLQAMTYVTGFHSHFDKDSKYEFRVLEMDGSASVAMNPIYLFLVVTDNMENNKLLEISQVSEIKNVRFFEKNRNIELDVLFDQLNEENGEKVQVLKTMTIAVPVKEGKIPAQLTVETGYLKTPFPRAKLEKELASQKKFFIQGDIDLPALLTKAYNKKELTDLELYAAVKFGRKIKADAEKELKE